MSKSQYISILKHLKDVKHETRKNDKMKTKIVKKRNIDMVIQRSPDTLKC